MFKRGLGLKVLLMVVMLGLVIAPANGASASVSSATQEVNAMMEQLAPLLEEVEKNEALQDEIFERPEFIELSDEFDLLFMDLIEVLMELDSITYMIDYIEEFPKENVEQLTARKAELESDLAILETRGEEIERKLTAVSDELAPIEETLNRLYDELYVAGKPLRVKYDKVQNQLEAVTKALEKNKKYLTHLTKQKKNIALALQKEKNSKNKQALLNKSKKLATDIVKLKKAISGSTQKVNALEQELQIYLDGLITLGIL